MACAPGSELGSELLYLYRKRGMCESLWWPLEQILLQTAPCRGGFPPGLCCAATRCPSVSAPCPVATHWDAAYGHSSCDLGQAPGLEAKNPPRASANPLHLSLMLGVSSVRCQHSLRLRASLSLALPSPCLQFHWNGVKRRRVHAGSGTDQQVSWECLSGSQRAPSLLSGFL